MRLRVVQNLGLTILIAGSTLLVACSSDPIATSSTATSSTATTTSSSISTTQGSSSPGNTCYATPNVQPSTVRPGDSVTLTTSGLINCDSSLSGGDQYEIRMRGANDFLGQIPPLGTVEVASNGSFTAKVTIPLDVQPGTWVFSFNSDKLAASSSDAGSCVGNLSNPFTVASP